MSDFISGALLDTRPEELKQKDHFITEIVAAAAPVNWIEKPESQWRKFLDQNQDGSGSCVAQTIKKQGQVLLWLKEKSLVPFSATPIYQRRSNRPSPGMIGVEAFDLWKNEGLTLEALVPSSAMNDQEMDSYPVEPYEKDIAKVFRIGGHVGIPAKDFDTVASVIQQTGKAVMIWIFATTPEWARFIPEVQDPALPLETAPIRHSVAAVDAFLYQGQEVLLIEDSSPFGGLYRRLITRGFYASRNYFARYPMNYVFAGGVEPTPIPVPNKPQYTFTKTLAFIPLDQTTGQISDPAKNEFQKTDVIALQNILKFEGFFPLNTTSTGYYGAVTAKAVLAFQKKYTVAPAAELDLLAGKTVGPKTRSKLNEIYGT